MSRTFRLNRDYTKTARDGYPWRGCGERNYPYCVESRTNKKINERIRSEEIINEL